MTFNEQLGVFDEGNLGSGAGRRQVPSKSATLHVARMPSLLHATAGKVSGASSASWRGKDSGTRFSRRHGISFLDRGSLNSAPAAMAPTGNAPRRKNVGFTRGLEHPRWRAHGVPARSIFLRGVFVLNMENREPSSRCRRYVRHDLVCTCVNIPEISRGCSRLQVRSHWYSIMGFMIAVSPVTSDHDGPTPLSGIQGKHLRWMSHGFWHGPWVKVHGVFFSVVRILLGLKAACFASLFWTSGAWNFGHFFVFLNNGRDTGCSLKRLLGLRIARTTLLPFLVLVSEFGRAAWVLVGSQIETPELEPVFSWFDIQTNWRVAIINAFGGLWGFGVS